MKGFFIFLSLIFSFVFFYCAGAAITDNYSEPDNKDHSLQNMIFVFLAAVSFLVAVLTLVAGLMRAKKM